MPRLRLAAAHVCGLLLLAMPLTTDTAVVACERPLLTAAMTPLPTSPPPPVGSHRIPQASEGISHSYKPTSHLDHSPETPKAHSTNLGL